MCQVRTSSSEAALHLIGDEKNIVLLTQLLDFLQIARRWYDYAALVSQASTHFDPNISPRRALDGLNHEGGDPLPIRFEGFSDVVNLTKAYFSASRRYRTNIWHKWPKYW